MGHTYRREHPVIESDDLNSSAESESLSHDYKGSATDISVDQDGSDDLNGSAESDKDRAKAIARISKALDQADLSVHFNPKGKRHTATLYVGNLEFNASDQDLRESLDKVFK